MRLEQVVVEALDGLRPDHVDLLPARLQRFDIHGDSPSSVLAWIFPMRDVQAAALGNDLAASPAGVSAARSAAATMMSATAQANMRHCREGVSAKVRPRLSADFERIARS
ncbi:hypothetical protein ACIRRA_33420 [Nocardia sp. NPDC101769]|uniref:hypothetical protein n=1 Tax=Nocardia sp. NPDC101769 TaxID=3364333 RepID=UPI0037F425B1